VAISITGSYGIPIENNVVHKTLDMGLFIAGHSNIIRNNLITLNYWPCTFVTEDAPYSIDYFGAIDVRLADSVVLENNYVAGSERIGKLTILIFKY
jgi:parallel beta-helix repeat protein